MDIDKKMLMDLAASMGIGEREAQVGSGKIENLKGKKDDELLGEILALKAVIKKDKATYNKQMNAIKALRPMMSADQRAKLDKIIKMMEE